MTRIILILLSVVAIDAIAQVKYTKPGEKMTLGALSYSRPRGDGLWSLQASFTPDSRGALGLNASINTATTAKTLGIFAEGAIVKPDSSLPPGLGRSGSFLESQR